MRAEHRFERAPARVYWELTRACDLACRHCRAEALSEREPDELTTEECRRVLGRLAAVGPPLPHVVFTGGDPLKRPDLLELVRSAVGLGLGASVAPSATHALSAEAVDALKAAGWWWADGRWQGKRAALPDCVRELAADDKCAKCECGGAGCHDCSQPTETP